MGCNLYDGSSQSQIFLINLLPWNDQFQGNTLSLDTFNSIKDSLSKDFEIDSQSLVEAIKVYLDIQSATDGHDYSLVKASLDDIINESQTPTSDPRAANKSDVIDNPVLGSPTSQVLIDTDGDLVDIEESRRIALEELDSQMAATKKVVDYAGQIKSSLDLSNKFQTNTGLLSRFQDKFIRDIFKRSFLDLDAGTIIKTVGELNNSIALYKQELADNITRFLGIDSIPLYNSTGEFQFQNYTTLIDTIKSYYTENEPTSRLNTINDLIYTKLSESNQKFLDAYNSMITLENFDNLIDIITNGLVTIDPLKRGVLTTPSTEPKYNVFRKNIIRSSFTTSSDINIERETASVTKAIINNIKKYNLNGEWDGYSYLTVNEFNTAISRINHPLVKKEYPILKDAHINPSKVYMEFFQSLFGHSKKVSSFKTNPNFDNSQKDILYSIYRGIFDSDSEAKSLWAITVNNQENLDFNYMYDIMAYINKQGPYSYISYQYNQDTQQFETQTFSNIAYESTLKNYEFNSAEVLNSLPESDIYNKVLLPEDGFGITYNQNGSIDINLYNGKKINLFSDLKGKRIDPITRVDLNTDILRSIIFPTPEQTSKILNGDILSPELMNGYKIYDLLQILTGFPFKNSSGQLYSRILNEYKNEDNLKSDLLGFVYSSLQDLEILKAVKDRERDLKTSFSPQEFLKEVRKSPKYSSFNEEGFRQSFSNPTSAPRLLLSRNAKGTGRSSIFKSIVSALSIINGDSNPSTYNNSEGDKVPSIGLMNLVKTLQDFNQVTKAYWNEHKENTLGIKNVFENNVFYNDIDLLTGIELKTEFVSADGTVVPKSKFNIAEYGVSSIILDFYKNLVDGNDILFLPTVYADKANQSLIKVSKDIKINGKTLLSATAKDIEIENKNRQKVYYTNIFSNLLKTYSIIGERLGITLDSGIDTTAHPDAQIRAVRRNLDIINDMLKTRFKDIQAIVPTLVQSVPDFEWVAETHYSKLVDGFYHINPFIEYMLKVYGISESDDTYYNDFINRSKKNFLEDVEEKSIYVDTSVFGFLKTDPKASKWVGSNGIMSIVDSKGKWNPIFDKFFWLDGYLSNQFMQITAGEPYAHPAKLKGIKLFNPDGSINNRYYIEDHAVRLIAQYKRMVMMQGTIHNYYQGALEGTGSTLNCAVIEDIKAPCFNPSGESESVKPLDGSMQCTPWQNVLENNSMFSSTAGTNRKNFGYTLSPIHGTPTLYKCASFAFTNYRMRKSPEQVRLLKKMTDRPWSVPVLNLMQNFDGSNRHLYDVIKETLYYKNSADGTYNQILDLLATGNRNEYILQTVRVNQDGTQVKGSQSVYSDPIIIDTNYKLWETFGGQNSYTLNTYNPVDVYLEPSEASVQAVAEFINKTGFYRTKEDLRRVRSIKGNEEASFKSNIYDSKDSDLNEDRGSFGKVVLDQNYIYQPMKHGDIHYLINESAIKVGARNINKASSRYDESPLTSFKIGSQYFGIQMNPDHNADDSHVTESTQIISTLAANGYTKDLADRAYRALGQIVNETLEEYFIAKRQYNELETYKNASIGNKTKLYMSLSRALLRALSTNSTNDAMLSGYLSEASKEFENSLRKEFNSGEFKYKIPFSAGSIHNQFITMITSKLNSDNIKRTFSGMGAVMIPSYGSVKYYHFDGTEGFVDTLNNPIKLIGTYDYSELQNIATTAGFRSSDESDALTKFLNAATGLNPVISNRDIKFGDIISTTILDPNGNTTGVVGEVSIDTYDKYVLYKNTPYEITLRKDLRKDLQPLWISFFLDGKRYSIYDSPIVEEMFELRSQGATEEEVLLQQSKVNTFLGLLEDGYLWVDALPKDVSEQLPSDIKVIKGKSVIDIGKDNVEVSPAEVVLSRIYKTKFFLRPGDSISEIVNSNGKFFREKLLRSTKAARQETVNSTIFDAVLLNPSGANVKIIINDSSAKSEFVKSLQEIDVLQDRRDDKVYRIREDGKKLYPTEGLTFYKDPRSMINQEIIVIDPKYMVRLHDLTKDSHYTDIFYNINSGNVENLLKFLNTYDTTLLGSLKNDNVTDLVTKLESSNEEGREELLDSLVFNIKNSYDETLNRKIDSKAEKMYRSFVESLNVTANRIPAQAFQSIMAMKVVGFSDSDVNEAYVAHTQIWLQGSDYDVDKAYITSPIINSEGIYAPWSNLFRYDSQKNFNLSKQLPYPDFDTNSNKHYFSNISSGPEETTLDVTDILLSSQGNFEATVKILNEIDRIHGTNVRLTYNPEIITDTARIDAIEDNIVRHNTPFTNEEKVLEGAKNFLFNSIYTITSNLKNHVTASSPIAMTDPQRAALKSKEGKKIMEVTSFTPSTKWKLFYANMAGKEGIGISAVGQKVFLAATQYFNKEAERLSRLPNLTTDDIRKSGIYFNNVFKIYTSLDENKGEETGKLVQVFCNTLANINLEDLPNVREIMDMTIDEDANELGIKDIVKLSKRYYQKDKSLVISALISAATDFK